MMQPKVLDFGIARMLEFNTEATRQTNIGEIIGTLAYMSPEQISADPALLDARGDLCSLGLLLYELLAAYCRTSLAVMYRSGTQYSRRTVGAAPRTRTRRSGGTRSHH
ncbi:MAG: hypothetical protein JOY71_23925 [Acetobacteraceae bacterium]|nr:hypothetical protein [Acetobacteraceae bacterium]